MKQVLVILGFILGITVMANATLIDHGSYSTDETTQLDWLDLSFSRGLSKNAVTSFLQDSSSAMYGYRYASVTEIKTMLSNIAGPTHGLYFTGWSILNNGIYNEVAGKMGNSWADATLDIRGITGDIISDPDHPKYGLSIIFRIADSISSSLEGKDLIDEESNFINSESYNYGTSSFLVRSINQNPVPEPATIVLFGIGILGLAGVSRRKN